MNRREILQMTGVGAAAAALPASADAAPKLGVRLYEVADLDELEKIAMLPPWAKRKEFKIVHWVVSDERSLDDIFNELSVAGYSYVECAGFTGIVGQYVFARTVPREALS